MQPRLAHRLPAASAALLLTMLLPPLLLVQPVMPAFGMGGGHGGEGGDGGGMGGGMGGSDGGTGGGAHGGGSGDDSGSMGGGSMSGAASDHEAARDARMRGNAPALGRLIAEVRRRHGGKVLDVRLQRGAGGNAYVFTIMTPDNKVRRVRMPLSGVTRSRPRRSYNFNNRGNDRR